MIDLKNKYNISFQPEALAQFVQKLTGQIWKLIPMYENGEDWERQLNTVILDIAGLNEIFLQHPQFLQLLTKLEGLKAVKPEFFEYRKIVFEAINLLQGVIK